MNALNKINPDRPLSRTKGSYLQSRKMSSANESAAKKKTTLVSNNTSFANNTVSIDKVYSPDRSKVKMKTTRSTVANGFASHLYSGITTGHATSGQTPNAQALATKHKRQNSARRSTGSRQRSISASAHDAKAIGSNAHRSNCTAAQEIFQPFDVNQDSISNPGSINIQDQTYKSITSKDEEVPKARKGSKNKTSVKDSTPKNSTKRSTKNPAGVQNSAAAAANDS